jgi:HEPN domain-containing protein
MAAKAKVQKTSNFHSMYFLFRAREFFSAGQELFASEARQQAPNKWANPTYFNYAHAAELALKAFLRSHNPEIKFGHELASLYQECQALGLAIGPDDLTQIGNIVTLLDSANKDSGLRYFMGPGPLPDLAWTEEVVGRLIAAVEPHVQLAEAISPSGLGKVVAMKLVFGKPTSRT